MSEDLRITLPDGRILSYTTFGTTISFPQPILFYFHGFPGTHNEGLPVHEAASKLGIAVVGVTRPGFGDSTPQPGRTLLSFAADVLYLADHLGAHQFAVMGISGGGPYALACLHALPPERLCAVAVVSSMWPPAFGMAGMTLQNRILFNVAPWAPGLVNWLVGREMNGVVQDTEHPERLEELMTRGFKRWPAEDQAVIFGDEGKLFKVLARSSRESIQHGVGGFACEAQLYCGPWGFAFEDLPVGDGKLVVWHGAKDVNVPIAMADKAAKLIPKVEYHRCEEEAHLSLSIKYIQEILGFLAGKLKV